MKVFVPYITPASAAINALFIQPTGWCARDCNGCYTKHFENQTIETETIVKTLIKSLHREESSIIFNQVTMALDKRNSNEIKSKYMLNLFGTYLETSFRSKKHNQLSEYHITVHTVGDLIEYMTDLNKEWEGFDKTHENYRGKLLNVLSVSHINNAKELENSYIDTLTNHINWNLTIDPSVNLEKIKDKFVEIAEAVNSIYLVLHKPSTGLYFDQKAWDDYQDFLKFVEATPPHVRAKVNTDGCISDSKKFTETGRGCSSNVSRFQVWPDGSVTGCAYNQRKLTPAANSIEDIVKNIYTVSKNYEFDTCKIPNLVNINSKYVKDRAPKFLELYDD